MIPRLLAPLLVYSSLALSNGNDLTAKFISDHGHSVYTICNRILRSHQSAEDCSQEIFLELYEKFFSKGIELKTTWKVVARRRAIDMKLFGKAKRRKDIAMMTFLGEWIPQKRQINWAIYSEIQTLKDQLASLDPEKRSIFDLYFVEGHDCPEIVAQTGLETRTLQRRVKEIRSLLIELNKNNLQ
jgi:RNA polymerase sigma factor (sigma-70 family)